LIGYEIIIPAALTAAGILLRQSAVQFQSVIYYG